jgi:hypothetical protein
MSKKPKPDFPSKRTKTLLQQVPLLGKRTFQKKNFLFLGKAANLCVEVSINHLLRQFSEPPLKVKQLKEKMKKGSPTF